MITAKDFLDLMQKCIDELILRGSDPSTAINTVTSVMNDYKDDINSMKFDVIANLMSTMFLGSTYENSLT